MSVEIAVGSGAEKKAAAGRTRGLLVLMVPLMLVLFIANLDQTIVATALPSIGSWSVRCSAGWRATCRC